MATYKYRCRECGGAEEVFIGPKLLSFKEDRARPDSELPQCSKCQGVMDRVDEILPVSRIIWIYPPSCKVKGYDVCDRNKLREEGRLKGDREPEPVGGHVTPAKRPKKKRYPRI